MAKSTRVVKKKKTSKIKLRLLGLIVVFGTVISILTCNCVNNLILLNQKKDEKEFLEQKMVALQSEEEELTADVEKLSDPTYIARYAREKYLYSKDGELIIRIPDDEE